MVHQGVTSGVSRLERHCIFSFCFSKPVPHCLTDVSLIPPCDRILLQMTFADLYRWSIKELRQECLGLSPITLFSFCFSKPVPHCLTDVSLIPPCDRILLQMTFADLYRWSIKELRQTVLQADHTFKSRGITPTMPSFNCQDNSNVSTKTRYRNLLKVTLKAPITTAADDKFSDIFKSRGKSPTMPLINC